MHWQLLRQTGIYKNNEEAPPDFQVCNLIVSPHGICIDFLANEETNRTENILCVGEN